MKRSSVAEKLVRRAVLRVLRWTRPEVGWAGLHRAGWTHLLGRFTAPRSAGRIASSTAALEPQHQPALGSQPARDAAGTVRPGSLSLSRGRLERELRLDLPLDRDPGRRQGNGICAPHTNLPLSRASNRRHSLTLSGMRRVRVPSPQAGASFLGRHVRMVFGHKQDLRK